MDEQSIVQSPQSGFNKVQISTIFRIRQNSSPFAIFPDENYICLFQAKLQSIMTPRNFVFLTCVTGSLPIFRHIFFSSIPIFHIIWWVLLMFSDNTSDVDQYFSCRLNKILSYWKYILNLSIPNVYPWHLNFKVTFNHMRFKVHDSVVENSPFVFHTNSE